MDVTVLLHSLFHWLALVAQSQPSLPPING
jgi:hypothetical protein